MNVKQPPRLGSFLLERLAPQNEALTGDLAEEYRAGRSTIWYWRQVVLAVAFHSIADLRRHPVIVLRGILLGITFIWVGGHYWVYLRRYDEWLFTTGLVRWFYINGYDLRGWAGWLAIAIMGGISGWIVGRSSGRDSGFAVVLAYALVLETLGIPLFWRLPANLFDSILVLLRVGLLHTFVIVIPALMGGMLSLPRSVNSVD
jgi:hypothetical protein